MPVKLSARTATLSGVVTVDDAEPLAAWLRTARQPVVRFAGCTNLHTAVVQALLAARPKVTGESPDPFLRRWVLPLLTPTTDSAPDEEHV